MTSRTPPPKPTARSQRERAAALKPQVGRHTLDDQSGADLATPPVEIVRSLALKRDLETIWTELAPEGVYARRGRRLFDLGLLALFGLPALALGLCIAALNLLQFRSVKKVFFMQERVGYRGELFSIIKFRTMADVRGDHFKSWGSGFEGQRVTRLGRFLRNTHFDELPQLINVARGEMAFVGPRPEMVEIEEWAADNVEGFTTRLAVPPGITGYAQITQGYTGHDVEAYREKFRVADWYRGAQCLTLDLKVIGLTLIWMLRGRGWSWKSHQLPSDKSKSTGKRKQPRR